MIMIVIIIIIININININIILVVVGVVFVNYTEQLSTDGAITSVILIFIVLFIVILVKGRIISIYRSYNVVKYA